MSDRNPVFVGAQHGPIAATLRNIAGLTFASGTWYTANTAIYIPFELVDAMVVAKVGVHTGATVAATNIDVGIYTENGTRLWSAGSTALGSANTLQVFTPGTTVKLAAGRYYIGIVLSTNTGTLLGIKAGGDQLRPLGVCQEASALPLPASATFATIANTFIPVWCITGRSTI